MHNVQFLNRILNIYVFNLYRYRVSPATDELLGIPWRGLGGRNRGDEGTVPIRVFASEEGRPAPTPATSLTSVREAPEQRLPEADIVVKVLIVYYHKYFIHDMS